MNKRYFSGTVIVGVLLLWGSFFLICLFLLSSYKVTSNSMEPTIKTGKRVFINKMIMGPRFRFSLWGNNTCFRLKGSRVISPYDIICFNYPHINDNLSRIDYSDKVYCKRVLGTPGERIGAVDGHCWNDKVLRPVGVVEEQEKLRWMFDSIFIWNQCYDVIPINQHKWNIKNWGPLIVPAKGLTVTLDDFSRDLYCEVIEYETKEPLDDFLREYTFKGNYYFALGDNAMDSYESRYWGFIPEDFIIGIVSDFSFPRK